ncbi:MAG TPA: PEGA domain-containing protein [Candidatus Cybelea sp.]|nr:PEGA domain-containing protein [Candidatus Cybelea sp.]
MIYITVNQPAGRELYVNGVYDESAGTTPVTVVLPAGTHKFETLTPGHAVDFRQRVTNVPNGTKETIALTAVSPPEPA